jgi:hypothetical protein
MNASVGQIARELIDLFCLYCCDLLMDRGMNPDFGNLGQERYNMRTSRDRLPVPVATRAGREPAGLRRFLCNEVVLVVGEEGVLKSRVWSTDS